MTTTWQYYSAEPFRGNPQVQTHLRGVAGRGAPLFITFISFNVFYFKGHEIVKPGQDPWPHLMSNVLQIWSLLFFPLTITLQSALYPAIEHQSNTWKHVYSLAVPRWSVYAGKLTLFTALLAVTMVLLFALTEGRGRLAGRVAARTRVLPVTRPMPTWPGSAAGCCCRPWALRPSSFTWVSVSATSCCPPASAC
jgi:hypothetical protein